MSINIMKSIRRGLVPLMLLLTLSFAGGAWALGLESAKNDGLVGEQPDGYLGVVKATPEAVELVSEVNEKRREAYQRIARENGITLDQVSKLAGQKAIDRTEPGAYIRTPTGQWVTK